MDEKEKLRVVIVDDEEHSRSAMITLLTEFCPSVQIEVAVSTITDARRAILQYAPDALFLDVELPPEGTGFDLLESIHPSLLRFGVVFSTGHSEYAQQAIRASAMDFLAKPVDVQDLERAVKKLHLYKRTQRLQESGNNIQQLLKILNVQQQPRGFRFILPTPNGLRIVNSGEVAFFTITPGETYVRLANGESFVAETPPDVTEQEILSTGYVKASPNYYVNSIHIQFYVDKEDGAKVILKNGHTIEVEHDYKERLFEQLKV